MAEEREKDEQGRYKVLTQDEYQSSFVDFYGQTLGATGIEVETPIEEEPVEKTAYVAPNIFSDDGNEPSNILSQPLGITNKGSNEFANFENITGVDFDMPSSYGDYLSSKGANKSDLSAIEKSIDNKLGGIANKVNKTVSEKYGLAFAKPTTASTQKQGLAQIGAKLMGANPMLSAIAGGMFSLDDSYKDPTGQISARPGGALGLAYDLNMSNQYANFASMQEAQQADDEDALSGFEGFGDKGFAARIGGQLVSRGVGKRNYDGVYDLSIEQLKNMEALQKGYSTRGFDPLNPDNGDKLAGTGKVGYDNAGRFHGINGVSAYGREQDAVNLGNEYGLTRTEVMSILSDVRGRTGMFSSVPEGKNLTQMLEAKQQEKKAIEDKRIEDARIEKEKADLRKADLERKRQAERRAEEQRQNDELDRIQEEARKQAERERQYRNEFNYGNDDNNNGGNSSDPGSVSEGGYGGVGATAMGGRIGMQEGGNTAEAEVVQPAGFIQRDPNATKQQEIADDIPLDAKKGDFVINAPAAKQAGKQDIERMISTAITNLQEKGVDVRFGNPKMNIKDNINLLVSRNEVYIPKIVAEEIGYDRLDKMNNRGKREVARRQEQAEQPQQGMNEGGFIKKKVGGKLDEFGVEINEQMNPKTKKEIKKLISRSNITRGSIENLINKIPERDALAVMIFAESYASKDSPDAMRGIGETAINRMKDKTYSFKSQNKLKDVLKGRSTKGEGSKMFSYEGLEPKYIKPRLSEMLNSTYWQKAIDAADNALETEPDMEQYKLRDDVFTYARIGKASDRLKSNKRNEYFSTIGDHDFYSRTPEKGGRISSETMGESPDFYR
tara:strand:- start:915 stop:3431 length:2517 start_codon:yes stop_codon:yes gene_type:complete